MNTKFELYFDKWKCLGGIFEVHEPVCANVWKRGKISWSSEDKV